MKYNRLFALLSMGIAAVGATGTAYASSHREAPSITKTPKVDGTDFYMFRSYEKGKQDTVTILANYLPLQHPYGGPNYFSLDPDALYEIHIDNNGDAKEDLTFQFKFNNSRQGIAVDAGGVQAQIPLINVSPVGPGRNDNQGLNVLETYKLSLIKGDRRKGKSASVKDYESGSKVFKKPVDYIGTRSIPDYASYARDHIRPIAIPGCSTPGRVFVGQRKEGFAVNLGQTFDLLNFTKRQELGGAAFLPIGEENNNVGPNTTDDLNITTLALEIPTACLTNGSEPVIGGWTTASTKITFPITSSSSRKDRLLSALIGAQGFQQVSRLSMPLVNEVVIGLGKKNKFNNSEPKGDGQFASFVTNPSFPELVEIVFQGAVKAPNAFPRADLVATFLTGLNVPGVITNQPKNVVASEMMRLNTTTPVTAPEKQSRLGVIGGDVAGYPNGRRPGDDVVDITLRVAMGRLITLGLFPGDAPSGALDFTDGALVTAADFDNQFPYLKMPLPGNLTE